MDWGPQIRQTRGSIFFVNSSPPVLVICSVSEFGALHSLTSIGIGNFLVCWSALTHSLAIDAEAKRSKGSDAGQVK